MYQQWRKSITTLAFVLIGLVSAGALAQAPRSPLAMKPDAPDRYVVVRGDTLWSIARRHGVSLEEVRRWNGLRDDRIRAGERLVIFPSAPEGDSR